jgi:hypothetical protein
MAMEWPQHRDPPEPMNRTRWLVWTVIVGLIPIVVRVMVYFVAKSANLSWLMNELDYIWFGLVLCITNVNELEGKTIERQDLKTWAIGLSVVYIILFSVMLGISHLNGLQSAGLDISRIRVLSLLLAVTSFLVSWVIYSRLSPGR